MADESVDIFRVLKKSPKCAELSREPFRFLLGNRLSLIDVVARLLDDDASSGCSPWRIVVVVALLLLLSPSSRLADVVEAFRFLEGTGGADIVDAMVCSKFLWDQSAKSESRLDRKRPLAGPCSTVCPLIKRAGRILMAWLAYKRYSRSIKVLDQNGKTETLSPIITRHKNRDNRHHGRPQREQPECYRGIN